MVGGVATESREILVAVVDLAAQGILRPRHRQTLRI